eukprot:scaffold10922_cov147-Cylindrotheca_fusiformis.AAC.3
MSSVSAELEALRKRNLTKNLAGKLKNADGLSTPEQEAATLEQINKNRRTSAYSKEAAESLKAGTKAVDQDLEFKRKQIALKKEERLKQEEASKTLQSFNVAKVNSPGPKIPSSASGKPQAPTTSAEQNPPEPGAAPGPVEAPVAAPADAPVAAPAEAPVAAPATSTSATVTTVEDDDGVPELEEVEDIPELSTTSAQQQQQGAAPPPPPAIRIPNRAEKKAKKTMEKLGMKQVSGISRVTLKMSGGGGYYNISQPDVYVSNNNNNNKNGHATYVVFGEAHQGSSFMNNNDGANRQATAAQQAKLAQLLDSPSTEPITSPSAAALQSPEDDGDDEVVDDSGLDPKDIDLVIGQAGVSRSKAVAALKSNDGDLVNAIMSLTN